MPPERRSRRSSSSPTWGTWCARPRGGGSRWSSPATPTAARCASPSSARSLTRSSLGAFYDRGRFEFAAPNARGLTTLYINPGIGMSVLPVRFDCPPRWALIELGE